jgi:anti-sigma factor ChrR (cupin superfamily)
MTNDPHVRPAAQAGLPPPQGSLVFPNLSRLAEDQNSLQWQPFHPGVDIQWLYRDGDQGPSAALIRFQPGGAVPLHEHCGLEHIYILSGSQAGSLMVHRAGTRHSILSEEGCLALAIYEKPARFIVGHGAAAP